MTLNYGWVYIERGQANAMQLACKAAWEINIEETAGDNIMHIAGDTHISISGIEEVKRVINIKEVVFKTLADFETCIAKLRALNKAGTMTLELAYVGTPAFVKIDGTNTSMEVKYLKATGLTKLSPGAGQIYGCKTIMFEQAG